MTSTSDASEHAMPAIPTTSAEEAMRVLEGARTIALVGISPRPERPSHEVAEYLIGAGYRVYLVNPAEEGPILGQPVYDSVIELPERVDIVDVFRRSEAVPPVVVDAIEARAGAVWLQLEIYHEGAVAEARAAGLEVVIDRCTKIEHERLIRAGRASKQGS